MLQSLPQNTAESNERVLEIDPHTPKGEGFGEANVTSPILSQATSARHGIKLLGRYIEQYGASETFGAQIADENEAWYFEVGSGHHWIAVRIPDDQYMVAA